MWSEFKIRLAFITCTTLYMLMMGQLTGFAFPAGLGIGVALGWIFAQLYLRVRSKK